VERKEGRSGGQSFPQEDEDIQRGGGGKPSVIMGRAKTQTNYGQEAFGRYFNKADGESLGAIDSYDP